MKQQNSFGIAFARYLNVTVQSKHKEKSKDKTQNNTEQEHQNASMLTSLSQGWSFTRGGI
jgi:hypothetical protein